MASIDRFENLGAGKIAREITGEIYGLTKIQQFARDFGLKDQIYRSAVAIMSNIADGFERGGNREFISFLSIAKTSAAEVRSQLYVALDQNYFLNRALPGYHIQQFALGALSPD